jgi:hypothetical protein
MSSYKTFNDCNKRQTTQINNITLATVLNNGNQASKEINMFDNSIQNVNNITFSDNTYIGVGNSFDICSNEVIKINNDVLAIDLCGNIGLGSIVPEEKLDVHGNAIVRGNLNVTGKLISNISEIVNSTNNIKTDIVTVNLVDASNIKVDNIQVKQLDASNISVDNIQVKQVDASNIRVDNIDISQNLKVFGNTQLLSDVSINGNLDISQNLKVDGRFDMNGDISMNGNLDINGNLDMKKNNIINVNVIDFSSNDASSNLINNLQGINFNDNTYIGVGNSFDICSNEVIKFNNNNLVIDTSGNVGFGKVPSHNLDVSGDLVMSGQITCFGNFASSSTTVIASSSRNLNNGFRFQSIEIGDSINNIIQSSHNAQPANFRISPYASTTPWLFINTSGNIGIGTSSPVSRLDVNGNIRLQGDNRWIGTTTANSLAIRTNNNNRIIIDSSGNVGIGIGTTTPQARLDVSGNLHVNGNITATGTITQNFSDIRLKYKIEDISNTLILLNKIHAFKYKHNSLASSYGLNENDNNNTYIGLSAQEIQEIYPELVSIAPFDRIMDENGKIISKSGENYLTLQYERLVPITITAIQELNNKIINLEKIIEKQQYQINLLLERL